MLTRGGSRMHRARDESVLAKARRALAKMGDENVGAALNDMDRRINEAGRENLEPGELVYCMRENLSFIRSAGCFQDDTELAAAITAYEVSPSMRALGRLGG